MVEHTQVVVSPFTDPWDNLALEEWLFASIPQDTCLLLLYINSPSVVIGKNQNPWQECPVPLLDDYALKLARRLTGGGTVYHDTGNLNFSFLTARRHHNIEKQLSVIIESLSQQGFSAQINNRYDVTIDDYKVSGNAFCVKRDRALHHGTLLVDSDLEAMGRALAISTGQISGKAIASTRAKVVNLRDLNETITVDTVCESIIESFDSVYGTCAQRITIKPDALAGGACRQFDELREKHASWAWQFGSTPGFCAAFDTRFDWGDAVVLFRVRDGKIERTEITSAGFDRSAGDMFDKTIHQCYFNHTAVCDRVSASGLQNHPQIRDLCCWIRDHRLF